MKSILFKNALYETAQLESISFFNTKAYISLLFDFFRLYSYAGYETKGNMLLCKVLYSVININLGEKRLILTFIKVWNFTLCLLILKKT